MSVHTPIKLGFFPHYFELKIFIYGYFNVVYHFRGQLILMTVSIFKYFKNKYRTNFNHDSNKSKIKHLDTLGRYVEMAKNTK